MDGETQALIWLAVAKWLTDLGLLWMVGVLAFRTISRLVGGVPLGSVPRQAAAALALLVVGCAARLWAQTYATFGLDEPVTGELIRLVAEETRWGGRWVLQAASLTAAVALAGLLPVAPRWGWPALGAVTLAMIGTAPLTGHAVAGESVWWPMLLQGLHLLGAGAWLGTLGVLLASGLAAYRGDAARVSALVDRFSPLALGSATTVAVTGGLTALLYVGGLGQFWTSTYGRVLLLKTVLFLTTAMVGAYNWRWVRPRLGAPGGVAALRRAGTVELTIASVLLAVTAWLVHLPMPGGGH